jgi:hypothetical protein
MDGEPDNNQPENAGQEPVDPNQMAPQMENVDEDMPANPDDEIMNNQGYSGIQDPNQQE